MIRTYGSFCCAMVLTATTALADPPSPSQGTSAATAGTDVRVKMINGDRRVALFRMTTRFDVAALATGYGVVPVLLVSEQPVLECAAPCNKSVDRASSYHVAGEGITPSAPFQFPPNRSAYSLNVDPGSSSSHTAGVILTTAGICLVALGGAFLAVAAVDRNAPAFVPIAGAAGGGVGLISMAVGIPLWISNETSVRVDAARNEIRLPAGMALRAQGITF